MAWGKKKQMNNAAAGMMPPPSPVGPQVVYTRQPHPGGLFLIRFLCAVALAPLAWWGGVFVFEQAGFKKPEQALAELLILVLIVLPLLVGVAWGVSKLLDQIHAHRQAMAQIELEARRYSSLTAGAPALPDGRLTDEEKRLFENLCVVMEQAYRDLAQSGPYGSNDKRPWSKRSVLSMPAPPRHGRMPDNQATKIREWLVEYGVVIGDPQSDQINTLVYPTWQDFRALVEEQFNMAVKVNPPAGHSPTPLSGRYQVIN